MYDRLIGNVCCHKFYLINAKLRKKSISNLFSLGGRSFIRLGQASVAQTMVDFIEHIQPTADGLYE